MLGAANVQAAAPEIRDVLEKGVADAAGSPWGSMALFGIDRVTKYHIDAPFYVSEQVWVLNKDKYDALLGPRRRPWWTSIARANGRCASPPRGPSSNPPAATR